MKVSLNNSLCFQMNNRRIGKVNEPGVNGLFSNSIALEAEKVKGDQYIGHSVSQPQIWKMMIMITSLPNGIRLICQGMNIRNL